MWAAITAIIGALGGVLIKWWQVRGPTPVQEGEAKGAAEARVQMEKAHADEVDKASAAQDAAVRRVASDSGLRDVESKDPNNRDLGA